MTNDEKFTVELKQLLDQKTEAKRIGDYTTAEASRILISKLYDDYFRYNVKTFKQRSIGDSDGDQQ